jgi:hypothetical protein
MTTRPFRKVLPRAAAFAGATLAAVPATLALVALAPLPVYAQAGEAGEAGAVQAIDEGAHLVAEAGLYEATVRIVAALYAEGDVAGAQEHLETSHHAFYEDVDAEFVQHGLAGFAAEAAAFAEAVRAGAAPEDVAAKAEAVNEAILHTSETQGVKPAFEAMQALIVTAGEDFIAGTDGAGAVTEPHEYRDAWGFVEVAKARFADIAGEGDASEKAAAEKALEALAEAAALMPGVSASAVGTDAEVLPGIAARLQFAALMLD